jgi:hypothetical protein
MVHAKYLSLLLWLLAPLTAYGVYAAYGLPHVIYEYQFISHSARPTYSTSVPRTYLSCTFIGFYGSYTVPATNGTCDWVRFFKPKEQR